MSDTWFAYANFVSAMNQPTLKYKPTQCPITELIVKAYCGFYSLPTAVSEGISVGTVVRKPDLPKENHWAVQQSFNEAYYVKEVKSTTCVLSKIVPPTGWKLLDILRRFLFSRTVEVEKKTLKDWVMEKKE